MHDSEMIKVDTDSSMFTNGQAAYGFDTYL